MPHSDADDSCTPSFATALREVRERCAERLGRPIEPETLVACFSANGYLIEASEYTAIEKGLALPLDLLAFVDAAVHCLGLAQQQRDVLLRCLAFDVLCAELGVDLVRQILCPTAD
jgi:hypothetical protein